MASFKLYDMAANECGKITLNSNVFNEEYKPSIIHEVVVAQQANARQGTKSTLLRSEVAGGKNKPHRQKKTGAARQGSDVGPHQYHGGVAFAPKPRDFSKKVNKATKNLAIRSALSEKARTNEIIFIDNLIVKEAKTKEIANMLKAFKLNTTPKEVVDAKGKTSMVDAKKAQTVLVILDKNDISLRRAMNNLPNVKSCLANLTNVLDVIKYNKVIMTSDSAKMLEEVFSK